MLIDKFGGVGAWKVGNVSVELEVLKGPSKT